MGFPKKIYTTEAVMYDKIPFYALDLIKISRLVKIKTKPRVQCLMVNTCFLAFSRSNIFVTQSSIFSTFSTMCYES